MQATEANPLPDEAVVREWGRRVEAEYRSSAITQELTLWLTRMSAPPGLLHEGLRVADDEVVHAELSLAVFHAAGGDATPALASGPLGAPQLGGPMELDVLHCVLRSFCLGETVAVRLFRRLREHCTVEVARTALDRVLRDEVRHREFGWTALEWLLSTSQADRYRRQAERVLPDLMAQQRQSYGAAAQPATDYPQHRRAWGLMPASEYHATLRECHEKDYVRLFDDLDICVPAFQ